MSSLSTHVLDTALGRPAEGVGVRLEDAAGQQRAAATTDADGRVGALAADLPPGTYRLVFDSAAYFARTSTPTFFPQVTVTIEIGDGGHHHVPLLLSPFAYSTYRGS